MKFISTEGHGYLRVTKKQVYDAILKGFNPSGYSFYNDKFALLEEDCDAGAYLNLMFPDKKFKDIPMVHQKDINRNCYNRFSS